MNCFRYLIPAVIASGAWADTPTASWSTQWQSKYVSEGRDNLPGSHFLTTTISASQGAVDAALFYGVEHPSPTDIQPRYEEGNALVGYSGSAGALDWRAGYKHLWFDASNERDNEWSLEFSTEALPLLTPTLTYTYATAAGGAFIELAVERELACGSRCSLTPYAMLAANEGFIPDSRRGMNNGQIGASIDFDVSPRLSLRAQAHYSRPFEELPEEGLNELLWLQLGLDYRLH